MRIIIATILSVFTAGYLLPFGIALARKRSNTVAIFFLDLLLGWTGIGWIAALIWAVAEDKK